MEKETNRPADHNTGREPVHQTYRYPVGVDIVGAVSLFERQKLDASLVVRQDVGEAVLGTVALHLGLLTRLVATNEPQLLSTTNELYV